MQAAGPSALTWAALVGLPAALAFFWRRTEAPQRGEDRVDPEARAAMRACLWGAAIFLAARTGPAGRPAFDAAANVGTGTAAVAGLIALARITPLGGLLQAHPTTRSLDAAVFTGVLWGIAVALPAFRALWPERSILLDPLAIDYATTTAGIGSLLVLVATAWRLRALRRFELGTGDRAAGALALALTAFLVAVPASAADLAAPDRVLPLGVVVGASACAWTATTREPTTVSSALRGILAVMILGAPTILVGGVLARQMPERAGAIALVACSLSIVVGLVARAVARPLGPEQSRWLDAIEGASRGALQPEPEAALRSALMALGQASALPGVRPELWRNDPEEVLSIDLAGYLHVAKGEAPQRLYELALAEPERTLRDEALRAVVVRRAEVRPLLAWFETRRAFSATVIVDEDGPLGFILLPRGARTTPMTLEEARAVRLLADRISALLSVSSALARSRERELAAIARADSLDAERRRLEVIIDGAGERHVSFAESLARSVRVAQYSPAARQTAEAIERFGRMGSPITLIAPHGADARGWAALAHLASARRTGPIVVVDGASSVEHDPRRWESDRSALRLADGGTLALLDASALPIEVQEIVGRTLARHAQAAHPSRVAPPAIVASVREPPEALLAAGTLSPALGAWLSAEPVSIPPLADRAEDLRSLILDELARTGVRIRRGEPLGIDASALHLLTEHTWPGNEAELAGVIARAAGAAAGRVVTAADLASIGFRPTPSSGTPVPPSLRRRPSSRAPRRR